MVLPSSQGLEEKYERWELEVARLKSIPGAFEETFLRQGSDPATSQERIFLVTVPKLPVGLISCNFVCAADYPQKPPSFALAVDGNTVEFQSSTLQNWVGNYLTDVVSESIAQLSA
jgi:hypothetical protein